MSDYWARLDMLRFFRFYLPAVRDDVDYLRRRYFDNVAVADLTVSLHTCQRHIELILGLFRYRSCASTNGP